MSEIIYTSMEEAWLTPQTTRLMDVFLAKQQRLFEENERTMALWEEISRTHMERNVRMGLRR